MRYCVISVLTHAPQKRDTIGGDGRYLCFNLKNGGFRQIGLSKFICFLKEILYRFIRLPGKWLMERLQHAKTPRGSQSVLMQRIYFIHSILALVKVWNTRQPLRKRSII
jgi:hypothetical protein